MGEGVGVKEKGKGMKGKGITGMDRGGEGKGSEGRERKEGRDKGGKKRGEEIGTPQSKFLATLLQETGMGPVREWEGGWDRGKEDNEGRQGNYGPQYSEPSSASVYLSVKCC